MAEDQREKMIKILDETHEWPAVYLYKFILKGNNEKIAKLQSIFKDSAQISTKASSGGKYISISVREVTMSGEEVLSKYDAAKKIEGVMVL